MAYGRNQFIDLAPGGLGTYTWAVNHSEERELGGSRNIERTATTDGGIGGVVRQQGVDDPLTLSFDGTIFTEAQHQKFIAFYAIGRVRTIDFVDFTGARYEVLIASYKPTRKPTVRNPRDPYNVAGNQLHYYTYTLELDVIKVKSGPWLGVA